MQSFVKLASMLSGFVGQCFLGNEMMRSAKWGAYVSALILLPITASADLVLDFAPLGKQDQSVYTFDATFGENRQDVQVTSFPSDGYLSIGGSSFASDSYSYRQMGGVTSFDMNLTNFEDGSTDGVSPSNAQSGFDILFTPTVNETFYWSTSWSAVSFNGQVFVLFNQALSDQTNLIAPVLLFMNDSFVNHTGSLIAGHHYELNVSTGVESGDVFGTPAGLEVAALNFTAVESAAHVPEPSSLALVGVGGICFWIVAYRRRRSAI